MAVPNFMHALDENRRIVKTSGKGRAVAILSAAVVPLPVFFFYLDKKIMVWSQGLKRELLSHYGTAVLYHLVFLALTFLSHGWMLLVLALALYLAGRYLRHDRAVAASGKFLFLGLAASGTAVQVLKHLVGRARPTVTFDFVAIGPSLDFVYYNSFPSGHTAAFFCSAYVLSRSYPAWRWLFYGVATAVGLDRIQGMAHFPSDVIAGALLGILTGMLLFPRGKGPSLEGQTPSR